MSALGRASVRLGVPSAAALLACHPVLLRSGWPMNDEALSWKYRTQMYLLHLAQGDLAPLWSTSDVFGQGSPLLTYYNKLFYYLAAPAYWMLGDIKAAVVCVLLGLLVLGAVGTHRCLRELEVPDTSAVCLAGVLPLASYTHAGWFARGAMAELSAAMIVPWLLLWMLRWVARERVGWSILPIMLALYLAHAIIAFFAVVLACVLLPVVFLPGARPAAAKAGELVRRGAVASACFLIGLSPWLYAMHRLSGRFALDDMKRAFPVQEQFRPLSDYLVGGLRGAGAASAQLDLAVWACALVAAASLLSRRPTRGASAPSPGLHPIAATPHARAGVMLGLELVFLAFLQTPWAAPIYAAVPGFDYIQFPWRLLAIITPLAVLLLGWLIVSVDRVAPATGRWLAFACLAGSAALSPAWRTEGVAFIPDSEVERPLEPNPELVMLSGGEYLPLLGLSDLPTVPHRLAYLHWLQARYPAANPRCQVQVERAHAEQLTRFFAVRCGDRADVVLPLIASGLERAWRVTPGSAVALAVRRTPVDPRMHVVVPAGEHRLHVELPSFPALLGWRGPRRAPPR
jgi:hypothetical protein